jgi:single-strand DNA-binding protein
MLNRVIIMGRLTADPELRQTASGVATCRFTVAVDRRAGQNGEKQADFITVTAWRQTAEFVSKYFSKGRMICVEGNLKTSTYQNKTYPDVTHYVTEVYADQVHFTGEKAADNGTNLNAMAQNNYAPQFTQPQQNVAYNAQQTPMQAVMQKAQTNGVPVENAQTYMQGFEPVADDGLPW